MRVENMRSAKGNKVANQFIVSCDNGDLFFQSYASVIVKNSGGKTYLDESKYNYSRTTAKYRNLFLCESSQEIEKKIKSGEYILTDLNEKREA